jgi:hypothetical protein
MPQTDLTWSTVDGGGQTFSAGGGYSVGGTIGQPDAQAAPVMSGGVYELTGGFWPVVNVCYCPADMNGDSKRDGGDVQEFIACLITGASCICADVDGANGVNAEDVSAFVTNLLTGGPCP